LRDSSRQWPMTRAAGEVQQDLSWLQTGRPCGRSSLTGQSAGNQTICPGWRFDGRKVAQLAASRRPEGLSGLILVAPAQPTPRRNPEEMRQGQLHAYDNREILPKTIGSGRLTARPPSPEILEQIVEDSLSGSRDFASQAHAGRG
jgi:pimeloyl-ACP methyl ester carboxylesterase